MKRSYIAALALMGSGLLSTTPALNAATITWGPATDTTAPTDVRTEGTLLRAYNGGASTVTVNGVEFVASDQLTGPGVASGMLGGGTTGDPNFDLLLDQVDYGGGTFATIDLGSFTPGETIEVQVFFTDQRTRYQDRVMRYGSSTGGSTVDLEANPDNTPGPPFGQFVIGTFVADGTDPDLTLAPLGFANAHITAYQIRTHATVPKPTLSVETNTVSGPFTVHINFTEAVTGLEESDFVVSNGTVTPSSLSGSGDAYTVEITPLANGEVTVRLPAGVVTDTDGEDKQNVASDTLTVVYVAPGSDQPTVVLSTGSAKVTGPFVVEVLFSEPVTGLAPEDFLVENGSAANLTGSGAAYTVEITPAAEGEVRVTLPANVVTDTDGDGLMNAASETLVVTHQKPDVPSVTLYGNLFTPSTTYELFLTFSEPVTGLEPEDFQVVNGSVTAIEEHGRYYSAKIAVASPGTVTVTLPGGAVTDLDGDGLTNSASNTLSFECRSDFGEQWVVDDEASWTAAAAALNNLVLSNGFARPTGSTAQFTSVLKTFPVKKKARTLTFTQSPVWDNWTAVPQVGPAESRDAPVIVSIEDGNYYYLALGSTGGYHAWHSTDMTNWVHKGPVTAPVTGRWVTSAEYKDGEFYIYSDYFNDHTPHLFKDRDLGDGAVGAYLGPAFVKDTHGSDCGLIRSDEDGLFHLIYEDWSPINARTHSWDSPLAGHTSSADGFTGFVPHEHQAPVDFRTNPTGRFGTYDHPDYPGAVYEIHTPEQDAFGDWTAIKIGSRFYLFGDYHPAGQPIRLARFTSDSIYKEFELVGSLASGHPDPTVCFAEERFYLLTQQNRDFISPGPWVDGVEARAGVDIDGDGSVDQWTGWQVVKEHYDHTPGFIRVVTLTPAQLDLSALPAGYGFQYEFRIDDTVVPAVSPIMDRVVMDFEPSRFQQWANANGIPAEMGGDHDTNGMPDVIEFAIGQSTLPERQPDGRLEVTATSGAMADGLRVELWFANNLGDPWIVATPDTEGVKLLSDTVDGAGNHHLVYEVFPSNGRHVFWTLVVVAPQ